MLVNAAVSLLVIAGVVERLGVANSGLVYAAFNFEAESDDELSAKINERLKVVRCGDETEQEWWWCQRDAKKGYFPKNMIAVSLSENTFLVGICSYF